MTAPLVYTAITSADGYLVDADGHFDWARPDEVVHAYVNDLERGAGTYLYGRRMYEVMRGWQTLGTDATDPAVIADYGAIWRSADKIVYSTTLPDVTTPRTVLRRRWDADEIHELKRSSTRPVTVGGAGLAAEALRAGLVDECRLILAPISVGGGRRALPDGVRTALVLEDVRRFDSGMVALHYRVGG